MADLRDVPEPISTGQELGQPSVQPNLLVSQNGGDPFLAFHRDREGRTPAFARSDFGIRPQFGGTAADQAGALVQGSEGWEGYGPDPRDLEIPEKPPAQPPPFDPLPESLRRELERDLRPPGPVHGPPAPEGSTSTPTDRWLIERRCKDVFKEVVTKEFLPVIDLRVLPGKTWSVALRAFDLGAYVGKGIKSTLDTIAAMWFNAVDGRIREDANARRAEFAAECTTRTCPTPVPCVLNGFEVLWKGKFDEFGFYTPWIQEAKGPFGPVAQVFGPGPKAGLGDKVTWLGDFDGRVTHYAQFRYLCHMKCGCLGPLLEGETVR